MGGGLAPGAPGGPVSEGAAAEGDASPGSVVSGSRLAPSVAVGSRLAPGAAEYVAGFAELSGLGVTAGTTVVVKFAQSYSRSVKPEA